MKGRPRTAAEPEREAGRGGVARPGATTIGSGTVVSTSVARRGRFTRRGWHTPLELGGLYWHLVDVIWIFLWPLFYLVH